MNRLLEPPRPIEQFPIAWADALPDSLRSLSFQLEIPSRFPMPVEWLGIVSSHNSRNGYANYEWQDSLRSALHLAKGQGWGVLCAHDVPYFKIIMHACKRFYVPTRVMHVAESFEAIGMTERVAPNESYSNCETLWLCRSTSKQIDKKEETIPIHDVAAVFLAHHLFVLNVREGGKIAQLLEMRLRCKSIPLGSSYLSIRANQARTEPQSNRSDWLQRGAIGWLNSRKHSVGLERSERCAGPQVVSTHQPVFPLRLLLRVGNKYLVHCTRSRRGPWPDQSITQFHDELLQCPWDKQPSALATLQRILKQQRLIATNNFRRGSKETVCFSSHEIAELLSMRRFQNHLARWDWEPYGIMIERDWLVSQGAKQVTYLDRGSAKQATDEELVYCHVFSHETGGVNWKEEQEWRILGDIRLNHVPFSKAIVFVKTRADARAIQPHSRWPIAYYLEP